MKVVFAYILAFHFLVMGILVLIKGQECKEPVEVMNGQIAIQPLIQ